MLNAVASEAEILVQWIRDVDLPAQLLNLIDQMMHKSSVKQVTNMLQKVLK